jgi:tetratricopeptide (TPR) repeat protein
MERIRQLDLLLYRGQEEAESQKGRAALKTFQEAVERDPSNWSIHNYISRLYLASRAYPDALRHIQEMLNLDPNASDGYLLMARYWYRQGVFSKAVDYALEAKRLRPGKAELRVLLGDTLVSLDRPREALEEYDAARKLVPGQTAIETRYKTLSKQLTADN